MSWISATDANQMREDYWQAFKNNTKQPQTKEQLEGQELTIEPTIQNTLLDDNEA